MSYQVYAEINPLDIISFSKLNRQFKLRHRVRYIKAVRANRKLGTDSHDLDWMGRYSEYKNTVVAACHWNREHMYDTADDIRFAANKVGLTVTKVRASSQEINVCIPEKSERYDGWDWDSATKI